jgi:hypothetical protein
MFAWLSRLLVGVSLIIPVTVFLIGCLIVDRIGERRQGQSKE